MQSRDINSVYCGLPELLAKRGRISCELVDGWFRVKAFMDSDGEHYHNFKQMNSDLWFGLSRDTKVELYGFMANLNEGTLPGSDLYGAAWFVNYFGADNVRFTRCSYVGRDEMYRLSWRGTVDTDGLRKKGLIN